MAKSYVALSINEKVKVIEAKEKDKLSVREIMMRFKCGKTQVYNTLKQKDKLKNEWLQGNGRMKRKSKVTGNEEINELVWEWFTNARSKNIHISGPMVQSEALAVARSLGNDQFKASTGWLDSFKKRHNIVWNGVCGESKDMDESVVSEYKPELIELVFFFAILYNAETWPMWKIYLVPCDSILNKFYCNFYTYLFAVAPPPPSPFLPTAKSVFVHNVADSVQSVR
jgi:hypothetical protein